jgi:hypothetical protein
MDSIKKLIVALICLVCLSSCIWLWPFDLLYERLENDDEPDAPPISYNSIEWYLENMTTETIVLNRHFGEYYKPMTILQESDTLLDSSGGGSDDDVFDTLWGGTTDSVVIKRNGKVVRVWRQSEKDNPGKQFFNKSHWEKIIKIGEETTENKRYILTFSVTPEDIALQ